MNDQWYPVPGFPDYEASELGEIRNIRTGTILKTWAKAKDKQRKKVELKDETGRRKSVSVSRIVCSAKEKRLPEDFEHTCHINGDCSDDTMQNLRFSDVVNNAIDEIECGRLTTTIDYIDVAIKRLTKLKQQYARN